MPRRPPKCRPPRYNDGDAVTDLSFEFKFTNTLKDLAVNAGGRETPVPLINTGPVDPAGANLNVIQTYSIAVVRHGYREAVPQGWLDSVPRRRNRRSILCAPRARAMCA